MQENNIFPSIDPLLIEEAINQNLITHQDKYKLILNPNQLSIFFTKFDENSPTTKHCLEKLNLSK